MRRTLVALSLVAGMLTLGAAAGVGIMAAYPGQAFAQGGLIPNFAPVADACSAVANKNPGLIALECPAPGAE